MNAAAVERADCFWAQVVPPEEVVAGAVVAVVEEGDAKREKREVSSDIWEVWTGAGVEAGSWGEEEGREMLKPGTETPAWPRREREDVFR